MEALADFTEGTLLWRTLDLGNGFEFWLLYCSKAVRKKEAPQEKIAFSGSKGRCQVKRESWDWVKVLR